MTRTRERVVEGDDRGGSRFYRNISLNPRLSPRRSSAEETNSAMAQARARAHRTGGSGTPISISRNVFMPRNHLMPLMKCAGNYGVRRESFILHESSGAATAAVAAAAAMVVAVAAVVATATAR